MSLTFKKYNRGPSDSVEEYTKRNAEINSAKQGIHNLAVSKGLVSRSNYDRDHLRQIVGEKKYQELKVEYEEQQVMSITQSNNEYVFQVSLGSLIAPTTVAKATKLAEELSAASGLTIGVFTSQRPGSHAYLRVAKRVDAASATQANFSRWEKKVLSTIQSLLGEGGEVDGGKRGPQEKDTAITRQEMELRIRKQIEREQKAALRTVNYVHNNEQVAFQRLARKNGVTVILEKNFIDLRIGGLIGEEKVNPNKGDFEHAFGHLALAEEVNEITGKFVLSIGKRVPRTILDWYTENDIHAISKIGKKYILENNLPGNDLLVKAIGA